jgi:hypothetical protein
MRARLLIPALVSTLLPAQAQSGIDEPSPRTTPERTHFARTSTLAEVQTFMNALATHGHGLAPWQPADAPSTTERGKPLLAWRLPALTAPAIRVYLNGNIHAGEVEGKEALQELARELVEGKHPELRKHIEFIFMPCYNAEGTDDLDPAHRTHQPNPESGVGRRETDRGLDLNRDAMKAEAANTRWYLAMLRAFDPHVIFDLHTTNGSYHGFHLTYAPALTLGGDPALLAFNRRLLNDVREGLKQEGMPTYDYGNFAPEDSGAKPEKWESYDPFPRYMVNHAGLTGRLGILSEAYVYRSFPERIADTKRFILASLRWIATHREEVRRVTREAQAARPNTLPIAARLMETERFSFDIIDPIKNAQGRVLGEKSRRREELPSFVTFTAVKESEVGLPAGYLVHPSFAAEIKSALEAQGIHTEPGTARPALPVLSFEETGRKIATRPYQGVFSLDLEGRWTSSPPKGAVPWTPGDLHQALWVSLNQPQGRLAFYLLDPRSPDGLVHWGKFHSVLLRGGWGETPRFPILAVGHQAAGEPSRGIPTPTAKKQE